MLETAEQTSTKVIRVVIIEDYKLTRMGLCSILKTDNQIEIVGEAEDGEKGIALVRQKEPNVVLMDLGLPGITGIEATQQIKAFNDNVKVIIYTSHEREEEVIAALGAGANAYCLKDSSPTTLIETIKTVNEGAAWLDPAIAGIALKIFQRIPVGSPKINQATISTPQSSGQQLTERELEVLTLLVKGKSNTEISKDLIISVHTAKAHVCNILQKLSVNDRVQAAVKAIKEGLV